MREHIKEVVLGKTKDVSYRRAVRFVRQKTLAFEVLSRQKVPALNFQHKREAIQRYVSGFLQSFIRTIVAIF